MLQETILPTLAYGALAIFGILFVIGLIDMVFSNPTGRQLAPVAFAAITLVGAAVFFTEVPSPDKQPFLTAALERQQWRRFCQVSTDKWKAQERRLEQLKQIGFTESGLPNSAFGQMLYRLSYTRQSWAMWWDLWSGDESRVEALCNRLG